jgi:RNA polymerase sigma factor (sigma-70 family)
MSSALWRYRDQAGSLPASLERVDLAQESWLILAELAERWRPEGGSFAAYFRVSFPWALARYVEHASPSRRSRNVLVLGAESPDVQAEVDLRPGTDGREWDGELVWSELIEQLSEPERAVLRLHFADQKPFSAVAQALQLSRSAAYRLYRRALRNLQGSSVRVGRRMILLDAESLNLDREGDLLGLVQAVHDGTRPDGQIPGRAWLVPRTGLSRWRLGQLLHLLAEAGCIRDRGTGRAGRLVHASPEETLAVLGIRAELV